jgi:hypothetical protein
MMAIFGDFRQFLAKELAATFRTYICMYMLRFFLICLRRAVDEGTYMQLSFFSLTLNSLWETNSFSEGTNWFTQVGFLKKG